MSLSPKHRRFVAEYLKDQNATKAAIRAGYGGKNADVVGPRLLGYVGIREAIDKALGRAEEKAIVSASYVLSSLKEIVERCMQRSPVMVFDKEEKAMVQATGEKGEGIWEFDSTGANKALQLLGQHLSLFTEKHQLSGNLKMSLSDLLKNAEESGD